MVNPTFPEGSVCSSDFRCRQFLFLYPGGKIRDNRNAPVAELRFPGERSFRHKGHPHDIAADTGKKLYLCLRFKSWAR